MEQQMFEGTTVLVAGGTGFIGSNLALRLANERCLVRATRHTRPVQVEHPRIQYVEADLTRMEDCRRVVEGVDYVFMCAANTSGAAVMTATPLVHVTPNVVMNAQLMQAAYDANVKKYLFISSSAAYPPTGDRPVREDEMFEGDPYDVYYAVGWMKRYAEVLCKLYAQRLKPSMPTVVIRPSNAYGPLDDFDFATSHMMAASIRRIVERHRPVEVWGTGNDVRDLIFIDDLVDGIITVFKRSEGYAAVNVAAGVGYSVKDVLKAIVDVDGFTDPDVRFDPSKPSTIPVRLIDITLAKTKFGFEARTGLKEGIGRTIDWYRNSSAALAHVQERHGVTD
jgi:GDP-L-fucose synthase